MEYEPVIGLEVHAQLKTNTKIFCGCSTAFGAPPNTHTCPVCLGMPGVLPVLNQKVVEYTLRMALATHCEIVETSCFARKNYFYPDLPKGYQISQYELPIARNGHIQTQVHGTKKRIGITRIHMEEDAGKLTHDPTGPHSFVDFNRTGVPLIEIVSEPDIRSAEEAVAYLKQLRAIIRYIDICDGNMEEGSFRCDANISLRPEGTDPFGIRTELKNINSFKFVEKGLDFEIERQKRLLEDGGRIIQETRFWDTKTQKTSPMRGKEDAHDYRYFPDPDLLPLVVGKDWIRGIKKSMPELPDVRQQRFITQYGLRPYDAGILTSERDTADYFEDCLQGFSEPDAVSKWIIGPLLGLLNVLNVPVAASPVSAAQLAELLRLVDQGLISSKMAKTVFDEMAQTRKSPGEIVKEKGLVQVTDRTVIEKAVMEVLTDFPDEVIAYQQGKTKLTGFFVGQIMKKTRGQANPEMANRVLRSQLDNLKKNKNQTVIIKKGDFS